MEAIPLVTTLTDSRNLFSLLLYSLFFLLVRRTLPRPLPRASCASCLCSSSPRLRSRGSPKWNNSVALRNNNNAVSFYSRDLAGTGAKWSESDEEGDVEARRDANEPLLMAVTLMIFPWLPASNLFFYVGFVVAGQSPPSCCASCAASYK